MEDYKIVAEKLNAEKDCLKLRIREIEKELDNIQKGLNLQQKYGKQTITVSKHNDVEHIRITEELLNENEKDEHLKLFGSVSGGWEKIRRSVSYFRVCDVLLHEGGGWLLLIDKQTCNDEEWEMIKNGNAPEKFKNPRI